MFDDFDLDIQKVTEKSFMPFMNDPGGGGAPASLQSCDLTTCSVCCDAGHSNFPGCTWSGNNICITLGGC